jgi:hypothetical protein
MIDLFVSFSTDRGFGSGVVETSGPPHHMGDITALAQHIQHANDLPRLPIILFWRVLGGTAED